MAIEININEITAQAHGLDYLFPSMKEVDLSNVGLNAKGRDALGRPYFMDVELYSSLLNETWRMPNEPLVRLSKRKHLVETKIAGTGENEGVVIEQISKGYYDIQIRGVLINNDYTKKQYPADQVEQLEKFCNSSEPLDIDCDLLELFKIRKIIIKEFAIDEMQGKEFSQRYVINCISYNDFYANLTLEN